MCQMWAISDTKRLGKFGRRVSSDVFSKKCNRRGYVIKNYEIKIAGYVPNRTIFLVLLGNVFFPCYAYVRKKNF